MAACPAPRVCVCVCAQVVLLAVGITAGVVVGLALFTMQTKVGRGGERSGAAGMHACMAGLCMQKACMGLAEPCACGARSFGSCTPCAARGAEAWEARFLRSGPHRGGCLLSTEKDPAQLA